MSMGRRILDGGYYVGTVVEHGDEQVITKYVKNQGRNAEG